LFVFARRLSLLEVVAVVVVVTVVVVVVAPTIVLNSSRKIWQLFPRGQV
jgi:hypothetical protein